MNKSSPADFFGKDYDNASNSVTFSDIGSDFEVGSDFRIGPFILECTKIQGDRVTGTIL